MQNDKKAGLFYTLLCISWLKLQGKQASHYNLSEITTLSAPTIQDNLKILTSEKLLIPSHVLGESKGFTINYEINPLALPKDFFDITIPRNTALEWKKDMAELGWAYKEKRKYYLNAPVFLSECGEYLFNILKPFFEFVKSEKVKKYLKKWLEFVSSPDYVSNIHQILNAVENKLIQLKRMSEDEFLKEADKVFKDVNELGKTAFLLAIYEQIKLLTFYERIQIKTEIYKILRDDSFIEKAQIWLDIFIEERNFPANNEYETIMAWLRLNLDKLPIDFKDFSFEMFNIFLSLNVLAMRK